VLQGADLVILEQANKYLLNYYLLSLPRPRRPRIAFWGHGRNRQTTHASVSEWLKRRTLPWVDWWFAYTEGVADYLVQRGFPRERVSIMGNTVDTAGFRKSLHAVRESDMRAFRQRWNISQTATVGLFCGSLYPEKHLEFLVSAARIVRAQRPDFELVIAGGGPQAALARHFADSAHWIHYVGPLFGPDKAACFTTAQVFLNPGLVGLSVVDAFCAGLPVFSTDVPIHSPEIEYLRPGVNGLITHFEPTAYAHSVASVLGDQTLLETLRRGAVASAAALSLDAMVDSIATGIIACLRASPVRPRASSGGIGSGAKFTKP